MNVFSLRTIIDDILLMVRNNNISESEDLSRELIRAWVLAYKAFLAKLKKDKDEEQGNDDDDSLETTIGPLVLQDESSHGAEYDVKRTAEKVPQLNDTTVDDIISVSDAHGCVIQFMSEKRKHYHRFRRYTFGEPTCWFENGYIYIQGNGIKPLSQIYVTGNFMGGDDEDTDDDDVTIPGWMIPDIKRFIIKNELSFMLNRPSDDSNNSTLSSVKPYGPQDLEK